MKPWRRVEVRRRWALIAATAAGAGWVPIAGAARPDPDTGCPSRNAVAAGAALLLEGPPPGADQLADQLEVRDLGERYAVRVKGSTREYVDEARDCDARARAAAVFVALTLTPPAAGDGDGPATARASVPSRPATPSSSPAPSPSWWDPEIELGASGATAPRADGAQRVLGADLHLVAMAARWGLVLGGNLPTASTIVTGQARVDESRFPLDLDLRRSWTLARLRLSIELGALVAVCQLKQAGVSDAATRTRFELGGRAAATVASDTGRFGIFLRLFSELVPVTQQIAVEPRGIIGRTSPVWVGGTLGVAARFR